MLVFSKARPSDVRRGCWKKHQPSREGTPPTILKAPIRNETVTIFKNSKEERFRVSSQELHKSQRNSLGSNGRS